MKKNTDSNKVRDDKTNTAQDHSKVQKNKKQAITANFQESMREDKRDPIERMETILSEK